MKQVFGALLIAVLASLTTLQFAKSGNTLDQSEVDELAHRLANNAELRKSFAPKVLSFSEPSEQDAWLKGSIRGQARPGPATDEKPLADSKNSVCFLSKVEFEGMNGPEDKTNCRVSLDEFTGWWQIDAEQGDGTDSSVACNARCIVWK